MRYPVPDLSGTLKNGNPHGTFTHYDVKGNFTHQERFVDGELVD